MSRIFASLVQSDFGNDGHGNLEAVVQTGGELRHWFRDSGAGNEWKPAQVLPGDVAGAGALIQSDLSGGDHGNFEVVVPVRNAAGGADLWHYFHDNSDVTLPWQRAQLIAQNVAGPGCIIQSDFTSDSHGNFEVVVPIPHGEGAQLRHFFHDNSDVTLPWQRGQFVTDSCNGWGCLIQGDFGEGDHGNFELLAEECTQSIVTYWHPNVRVEEPWLRHRILLGEPYPRRLAGTSRIAQLTGEFDRTGWNGIGTPPYAHNRTESAVRIRGTDLGVSFPHRERTYFLFGDTWRVDQPEDWVNLDSIAYTDDTNARNGLDLTFFYDPPRVSDGISQREFEVPIDGVSAGDSMLVFFSTDHHKVDGYDLMGRSVLTRCDDDGFAFTYLADLSRYKFLNVSVQRAALDRATAAAMGLPGVTDVLWIWGSGRYRSSDVYLAVTPFEPLLRGDLDLRFFSGSRRITTWSRSEEDATPLFCNGAVGELSVRWNGLLGRWLATFNSDNPRGILLHSAPAPWGPWTQRPLMVFDPFHRADPADPCSGDGYGRFMHIGWSDNRCDHVQDDMFTPGSFRDDGWGGEYGPYQISNYSERAEGGAVHLYFSMSTWNPYQSMLMRTEITPGDLTGDR